MMQLKGTTEATDAATLLLVSMDVLDGVLRVPRSGGIKRGACKRAESCNRGDREFCARWICSTPGGLSVVR